MDDGNDSISRLVGNVYVCVYCGIFCVIVGCCLLMGFYREKVNSDKVIQIK